MILDPNPPAFPAPWAVTYGEDRYGLWQAFDIGGVRQVMRWIEPGRFAMGAGEGEPDGWTDETRHTVTLTRGYWLADTACSQALWQAVTGDNPSRFDDDPENPVERVSWEDCQVFLSKANGRLEGGLTLALPTEAQWEYACRAGSTGPFAWGDGITTDQANFDGNHPYPGSPKGEYRERTVPVLSFAPNAWGLFQMHGNVWEWCADWLADFASEPIEDPEGPAEGRERVLRGGSWIGNAQNLRSAQRRADTPDFRNLNAGFRLAGG